MLKIINFYFNFFICFYRSNFDSSYHFNVNNYRFFVKSADGVYVKFWLMSYYNVNGESGYISMAYQTIFTY